MKRILTLLLAILCLNGCSTHLTDFSLLSNKNINLDKINIDTKPTNKNVIGEDKKFMFLFIPFGQPTIKGALNDALEKGNGDLMVDASLYQTGWWFLIGEIGLQLKGDVIKTREGK